MKSHFLLSLAVAACLGLTFQSCLKDKCERTVSYIRVEPVFKTLDEIHSGTVVQETPRALVSPGQLYFYNDLIFINERHEGIHVIDNTHPENPVNSLFISIPGNDDIAIKDGVLYANSYVDLLAINLQDYQVMGRVENVFPPLWEDINANQVAVYYKETPVTEVLDCESYGRLYQSEGVFIDLSGGGWLNSTVVDDVAAEVSGNATSGSTGIGGSMARFSIVGNYLYAVDFSSMDVFDLAVLAQPSLVNTVNFGWGIETIFPYEDKLFIGSNAGMFIFDNSNPELPVMVAEFAHARACDPVVVSGDFAYVTLRNGSACEGFVNQLDLIDISNIFNPTLVKSFPMDNPHGLSIKGDHLFLCEGDFGLKSFDITIPAKLDQHLLDQEKDVHAYDAIALPGSRNLLLVIGEDGFYQYNFDNPSDLKLVSKIPIP